MTSLPQLPTLGPLVSSSGTSDSQTSPQAGAPSTGSQVLNAVIQGLTFDPVTSALASGGSMNGIAGSLMLRVVMVVGGLGMILLGFSQFRTVKTVAVQAVKAASKAAEVAA